MALMLAEMKESRFLSSGVWPLQFAATLIPSNRTRADHCRGEWEQEKRKKRCEAAAATELESSEVTGVSGALRLAQRGRTGWTDATRVLCLGRKTVR